MIRTACVLCECPVLDPFYTLDRFPLMANSVVTESSLDVFDDLEFKICNRCRCVQLVTLVDPSTLYAEDNKSALTPTWKRHHTAFASFVEATRPVSICEVGGGSNPLVSFFAHTPPYSVLDIYECQTKVPSVTYRVGNCETFTEYTEDSVILSHTFEHLYTPHAFLKSIRASAVQNVFISVPHFASWLAKGTTLNILFNQHTFYFEKDDIERLFATYGFSTERSETFEDHSLFFHFRRRNQTIERSLFRRFDIGASIREMSLTTPAYIMPSFYIGQLIHHYMPNKALIRGFLDNDTNKVGKRLYGTQLLTYSPSILTTSDCKRVLLCRTPYFDEMSV